MYHCFRRETHEKGESQPLHNSSRDQTADALIKDLGSEARPRQRQSLQNLEKESYGRVGFALALVT